MTEINDASAVTGVPRLLLRLEGGALAAIAIVLYAQQGASWWLFAALILAPDLSFLGYLAGPRMGAIAYNAAHTLVVPFALALVGGFLPASILIVVALIWAAHIGVDRALGYGLKYARGFGFTHLGRIGSASAGEA
jgi:hypothetical protein